MKMYLVTTAMDLLVGKHPENGNVTAGQKEPLPENERLKLEERLRELQNAVRETPQPDVSAVVLNMQADFADLTMGLLAVYKRRDILPYYYRMIEITTKNESDSFTQ